MPRYLLCHATLLGLLRHEAETDIVHSEGPVVLLPAHTLQGRDHVVYSLLPLLIRAEYLAEVGAEQLDPIR
jgi:hypothetical protein